MTKVEMRIEGTCSGNPGQGGWCVILTYGQHRKELSGHADATTNQQMELTAVIEGLRALKRPCEVAIYSDSEYVIKGITEHQRHEQDVDLWGQLLEPLTKNKVSFTKVAEKSGDALFDECHKIAKSRTLV